MTETNPLIVFTPSGKRGRFAVGTPVLQAARALGVDIDSVCGGRAICGRCQVVPMAGSFPKHGLTSAADHLIAFTEPEQRYRERDGLAADLEPEAYRTKGVEGRLAPLAIGIFRNKNTGSP